MSNQGNDVSNQNLSIWLKKKFVVKISKFPFFWKNLAKFPTVWLKKCGLLALGDQVDTSSDMVMHLAASTAWSTDIELNDLSVNSGDILNEAAGLMAAIGIAVLSNSLMISLSLSQAGYVSRVLPTGLVFSDLAAILTINSLSAVPPADYFLKSSWWVL